MTTITKIPEELLRRLYVRGSLQHIDTGFRFSLKNRLADINLQSLWHLSVQEQEIAHEYVTLHLENGDSLRFSDITPQNVLRFALAQTLTVVVNIKPALQGRLSICLGFSAEMIGEQTFTIEDDLLTSNTPCDNKIPRDYMDDYGEDVVRKRQDFVERISGHKLTHIKQYSFDTHTTQGNIENFTGVAQIPIGFAGPLHVNGEYAQGEFIIPLATTEGTLVASYNRGIKTLNMSGGVHTTILEDAMQRAPVFVFSTARAAREFVVWVNENLDTIRQEAEATSSIARLQYIDPYLASKFAYLRFNFTTGDAAGQNMVGRATYAACNWILANYDVNAIQNFYLESNFATDKKPSQVNMLHTRGKRVTAEAIIKRDVLQEHMRVTPENLHYHACVSTTGAFLSGANNNGAHSANAITALFIATGQDVANVSESSAGVLFTEITPNGELYVSMTLPSLIVATYGGGTSLATQRECLEVMGCFGKDKVRKFAEIVAGVVLAGELSLGAAISSSDWVKSHELMGRNR